MTEPLDNAPLQEGPPLVGPWTMGRDKNNPKPLDGAAFITLVKTASELVCRSEQQLHATLHQSLTVNSPLYLHKTTNSISQNQAMVCIEYLQVSNMSKSPKGRADKPGKNVAAKSGLNKSILDQGCFEFRRQLEYKLNWSGGMLTVVPAHNMSHTCPACGQVGSGLGRKSKTKPASAKREPTEATTHGVSSVGISVLQGGKDVNPSTLDKTLGMLQAGFAPTI